MDIQKLIEMVLVYGKTPKATLNRRIEHYSLDAFEWKIREQSRQPKSIEIGDKKVEIFEKEQYEIIQEKPSKYNLKEIWASGKILDGNSSGRFFRDHLVQRQNKDSLGTLYKVYGIGDDIYDYRYFTGPKKNTATKGKYYQGVPKKIFENTESHMKSLPVENFLNYADAFGNCRLEGGVDFRSGKKPVEFLKHLLNMALNEGEENIVIDSFAGSGSTAHALLDINKNKNQNNRFILVELESEVCREKTSKRVANVINEYSADKIGTVNDKNGFQYCILGKSLFDNEGKIDSECTFGDLASYIYFTETKAILDKKAMNKNFIGEYLGTKYYLIFKEIGKNNLNLEFLRNLEKDRCKIIYADKCTVSYEQLEEHNAIFKQIPYEVRIF